MRAHHAHANKTILDSISTVPTDGAWRSEVTISPGNTLNLYFIPRQAVTITEITVWAVTAPASASGTYLLTAAKNGSNNLLSAANFDLETITNLTHSAPALTGTAADLNLNGTTDYAKLTFTSNNADLTGAGLRVTVKYTLT